MTTLIDRPARLGHPMPPVLPALLRVLLRLGRARAERRELERLDDRMLGDIGLNRAAVERALGHPLRRQVDWAALERARR